MPLSREKLGNASHREAATRLCQCESTTVLMLAQASAPHRSKPDFWAASPRACISVGQGQGLEISISNDAATAGQGPHSENHGGRGISLTTRPSFSLTCPQQGHDLTSSARTQPDSSSIGKQSCGVGPQCHGVQFGFRKHLLKASS